MSWRGNCYDNAMMESFCGTLNAKLFGPYVPPTKAEARLLIFEYIELYYNRRLKHSALGFKTPWTSRLNAGINKINHAPRVSIKPGQPDLQNHESAFLLP